MRFFKSFLRIFHMNRDKQRNSMSCQEGTLSVSLVKLKVTFVYVGGVVFYIFYYNFISHQIKSPNELFIF